MIAQPTSHAEVIDRLGGRGGVAEHLGLTPSRVGMWKTRDRIPSDNWPAIERTARALNVPGIDVELLERIAKPEVAEQQLGQAVSA